MLGLRGAARYVSPLFRPAFELECRALKKVRETLGLSNVEVMIPFVRTVEECATVVGLLAANGLARGDNGLRLIMMCEIPSNVLLAEAIAACKRHGKYIGICGQGPSDHPDLADWLVAQGIGSISLNPDTVVATWRRLTQA